MVEVYVSRLVASTPEPILGCTPAHEGTNLVNLNQGVWLGASRSCSNEIVWCVAEYLDVCESHLYKVAVVGANRNVYIAAIFGRGSAVCNCGERGDCLGLSVLSPRATHV
eukprot:6189174-Pleurochrysis_carterae.AAC.2